MFGRGEVNAGVVRSQAMNRGEETMGDETMNKLNIIVWYAMKTGLAVIIGLLFFMLGLSTANAAITDGGFEAGTPNPYWTESSTNFGTPICSLGSGCGGANQAHTGDWWAWFGGIEGVLETGTLSQQVLIPTGVSQLNFWFSAPNVDLLANDFIELTIDGNQLWSYSASGGVISDYTLQSLDISDFADDTDHILEFSSTTLGENAVTNFFVDDVSISAVPVPAAYWLFGSGLLGLVGISRRNKEA
jgi:hypothetical protein